VKHPGVGRGVQQPDYVYPYCGRFDTIDFLFCNLRNLNGFISVGIGAIHTAKT